MKRKILAAVLLSGMLLTVTACGKQENTEPEISLVAENSGNRYLIESAEYGEVVSGVTLPATFLTTEEQEVRFAEDGFLITQVNVKKGDYVTKGQLLMSGEVQGIQDKMEEQESQIESLELQKKQTEELQEFDLESADIMYTYTKGTQQDKNNLKEQKENIMKQYKHTLEDIEDNLTLGRLRLQEYQEDWDKGRLVAAISGEVTFCKESLLDTYSKKTDTVLMISNMESSYFVVKDTTYAEYFTEGTPVELTYWTVAGQTPCSVLPVKMDQWETEMYFALVGENIVSLNTSGSIYLELDRRENVLRVPVKAVHQSDKGDFVYLTEGDLLEMRYVKTGLAGENFVEITEGLEQGDTVVVNR